MSCIIQVIIFTWYVVLICVPVNVKYANQQMGVQEGSKKGRSGLEMLLSKAKQKPDLHLVLVLPRVVQWLLEIWMKPTNQLVPLLTSQGVLRATGCGCFVLFSLRGSTREWWL